MTIEFSDKTIGIWAVDLMNGSDFLGGVWRDGDNYVMEYRFRYYVDDKTFDSEDKKNWYSAEIPTDRASEDDVVGAMREVVKMMWKGSGGQRYELLMGSGGVEQMMAELKKWPMISMMTAPLDKAG